jgi:branched-chain amino acid transport system substrate-binding protein
MRRKINGVVKTVGLVFLTLIAFFTGGISLSQGAEPIKVGAVLALTGWAGFLGTPEKQAIALVVDEVNRHGGVLGRPIEVYYEDDQSNPTNSAIAATKLIRDKKVSCLIGSTLTVLCMPVLPIVEREQVLNISMGAGQEITVPLKKWVFRIPATDRFVAAIMLKYAVETLGAKRIAILYSSDASGTQAAKAVQENIDKYKDASIIITEQFDPKDTNVIPQLTKIKAARPDVLILNTTAAPAIVVAKNYQQLGLEMPVVPGQGVVAPEFLKGAGKIVEGKPWIFRTAWSAVGDKLPPDDPRRVKIYDPFVKALKEKYGVGYSPFHGNGYDAIHIFINALKIAGTDDRVVLRDAMERVEHDGLIGHYKYSPTDHDGLDERSTIPMIIKNNEWWPYTHRK